MTVDAVSAANPSFSHTPTHPNTPDTQQKQDEYYKEGSYGYGDEYKKEPEDLGYWACEYDYAPADAECGGDGACEKGPGKCQLGGLCWRRAALLCALWAAWGMH